MLTLDIFTKTNRKLKKGYLLNKLSESKTEENNFV